MPASQRRGPVLLLTVGPAASGKSTHLTRMLADGALDEVVSTDVIRAELGLAPDETEAAYREARRRVAAALRAGRAVAVDATNVRPRDRARWQRLARGVGPVPVVALRTGDGLDVEALLRRDAGRERHVPAAAIAQQVDLYRRTASPAQLLAEGFATVLDAEPALAAAM